MPRKVNEEFEAIFHSADHGMTLRKAWVAAGKPTTYKNVERYYSKHRAAQLTEVQRGALLAQLQGMAAPPAGKRKKGRAWQ